MSRLLAVLFLWLQLGPLRAQLSPPDSLRYYIATHKQPDTLRVNWLNELGWSVRGSMQRSEPLAAEALRISRQLEYAKGEVMALRTLSYEQSVHGNIAKAIVLAEKAVKAARQSKQPYLIIQAYVARKNAAADYAHQAQDLALALTVAQKAKSDLWQATVLLHQAFLSANMGEYLTSVDRATQALQHAATIHDQLLVAKAMQAMGNTYLLLNDYKHALKYNEQAFDMSDAYTDPYDRAFLFNGLGETYRLTGNYKDAIRYYNQALQIYRQQQANHLIAMTEGNIADVCNRQGRNQQALLLAQHAINDVRQNQSEEGITWLASILARTYLSLGQLAEAERYGREALAAAQHLQNREFARDASHTLTEISAKVGNFADAYRYQSLYIAYRDSILNPTVVQQSSERQFSADLDQKEAQINVMQKEQELRRQQRQQLILALVATSVVLTLVITLMAVLYRNNRQKQRANALLQRQKEDIEHQRDQTSQVLNELKNTQNQLIHKEKMASLGELTAGIAHEIQNPLNFVNNFSDVSSELLTELTEEIDKTPVDKDYVKGITDDLNQNLQKITHHGIRASSIVKAMLEHSRTSSGQQEPTDLNALCNEYLHLAYHGLRAKNKAFNCSLVTDFAQDLPLVTLNPQDLGRVLLNLFNNAFYTVEQKVAQEPTDQVYQPTVTVSTKLINDMAEVRVHDNGTGMSEAVKAKIFQPFFTTKPTGSGTGLGLSLVYDIVTKGHQGTLQVESEPGIGTTFSIRLPFS